MSQLENENTPPTRTLAEELFDAGESLQDTSTTPWTLLVGEDDRDTAMLHPFGTTSASDDLPGATVDETPQTASDGAIADVPSDCDDFGATGCDSSFMEGLNGEDDEEDSRVCSDLFSREEDSSGWGDAFDRDLLEGARGTDAPEHLPQNFARPRYFGDLLMIPPVPVMHALVDEHNFAQPTLLTRRLHHLRQLHVLVELEKLSVFTTARPLIMPTLHSPYVSRGSAGVSEQGTIGDWVDVDRPEPRYVTQFHGQPALLLEDEREILREALGRDISTP